MKRYDILLCDDDYIKDDSGLNGNVLKVKGMNENELMQLINRFMHDSSHKILIERMHYDTKTRHKRGAKHNGKE